MPTAINVTDTGTLTANGQAAPIPVTSCAAVAIQIGGTWTGTLSFEGTVDNVTWAALGMTPLAGGAAVTSTTGNGTWLANVGALNTVRVHATAAMTGSAAVTLSATSSVVSSLQAPGQVLAASQIVYPGATGTLIGDANFTRDAATGATVINDTSGNRLLLPSRKMAGVPQSARPEIQQLAVTGTISGGTFTAQGPKPDGTTSAATSALSNTASPQAIANALVAVSVNVTYGTGPASSTYNLPSTVQLVFNGAQANSPQALITINSSLSGGGSIAVQRVQAGYAGDFVGALAGDLAMDTTTGNLYVNTGTTTVPIWRLHLSSKAPGRGVIRLVTIGDSTSDGGSLDQYTIHTWGAADWHYMAAWLSGGTWQYVRPGGIGGASSAAILASMPFQVFAQNPTHCAILCGVNDCFDSGGTSPDVSFLYQAGTGTIANITAMVNNCIQRGIVPILTTLFPNSVTGVAAKQELIDRLNDWLRAYAGANDILLFDLHAAMVDPATGKYLANMTKDNTHAASGLGTRTAAVAFAAFMNGVAHSQNTIPLQDSALTTSSNSPANLLTNGLMLTPSAGVASSWTGTAAQNGTYTNNATDTALGKGNSQQLAQAGTLATAAPTISGGVITGISGLSGGALYLIAPSVQFYDPTGAGSGASATATISGGAVTGITGLVGGTGYSGSTVVQFNGGFGAPTISQVALLQPGQVNAGDIIGFGGRILAQVEQGQADPNLLTDQYLARLDFLDKNAAVIEGFYPIFGSYTDTAAGTFWQTRPAPAGVAQIRAAFYLQNSLPGATFKVAQVTVKNLTQMLAGYTFNPTMLPGLVAWFRADRNVTLNGATVLNWTDHNNANSFAQATAGRQPTFIAASTTLNNQPSLRFDGARWLVQAAAGALYSTGFHVFIAGFRNSQAGHMLLGQFATGGAGDTGYFADNATPSTVAIMYTNSNAQTKSAGAIETAGQVTIPKLWEFSYDGVNLKAQFNGGVATATTPATGTFTAVTTPAAIGAQYNLGGSLLNGDIAEIVIFNRALNASEQSQVQTMMRNRYALY